MADPNPKIIIRAKDESARAFKSARSNMRAMRDGILSLQGAMVGLAGVGFGAFIKRTLEAQDEIGKLSIRLGASTEALSQYRHVAELSGVTFNQLTIGWQRMARRVAEAAAGTGEARNAIEELGLSAVELNKLRPDQQFEIFADALKNVESETDRLRLAFKLFDSEGVQLLQGMRDGAEGLREMRREADELGLTLSQDQVDAAAEANDAMTEFEATVTGLANQLTTALVPSITKVAEALSDTLPTLIEWGTHITDRVGIEIAALWDFLNPSDITGPTTLEQSFRNITEQADEARRATEELRKTKPGADVSKPPAGASLVMPGMTITGEPDKKDRERFEARLEALREGLMTEEQLITNSYNKRQETIGEAFERGLLTQAERYELLRAAQADHEAQMTEIARAGYTEREKFAALSTQAQTDQVLGETLRMTRGVAQHNKTLFKINKVAGIAQATINAWQGASRTMAEYPYPLNVALAALSLSAGLAQVQAIKGTSFSGGGAGGIGSGGSVVRPPSDAGTVPAGIAPEGPREINITVSGSGVLERDQAAAIARSLRDYINDGGDPIPA